MAADVEAFLIAQARLGQLMDLFQEVTAQRAQLDAREAALTEDWKAWYHIYEKEKPGIPQAMGGDLPPDLAITLEEGATAPMLTVPEEIEKRIPTPTNRYGAKTAAVMQILTEAGEGGILPKELSDRLALRGIKASESFAGNTLFRLRKRGKVFLNGEGKYVLSSFLPKEELSFQAEDRGA